MLMIEAVDAYFTMMRLTTALIEAEGDDHWDASPEVKGDRCKNPDEWHRIVAKAALGDGTAIGQVFERYRPSLIRVAIKAGAGEDAEDVVMSVMMRVLEVDLKKNAPIWCNSSQRTWAFLSRSVSNLSRNWRSKGAHKSVGSGGEDTPQFDQAAPTDSDDADKVYKTVQDAITRHLDAGKYNDKERAFIQAVANSGQWKGKVAGGGVQQSNKALAAPLWPHLTPEKAASMGGKAKARFLKSLCNDPELKALVDLTGAGNTFNSICGEGVEADPVFLFALAVGLVESVDPLDPDTTYDVVLGWLSHFV